MCPWVSYEVQPLDAPRHFSGEAVESVPRYFGWKVIKLEIWPWDSQCIYVKILSASLELRPGSESHTFPDQPLKSRGPGSYDLADLLCYPIVFSTVKHNPPSSTAERQVPISFKRIKCFETV